MVIDLPHQNGAPVAEDNIINRRGGESIYQSCLNLRKRIAKVPGFEDEMARLDEEDRFKSGTGESNPVETLWIYFREGQPLLNIYNACVPQKRVELDLSKVAEKQRTKLITFKFLQACLQELSFPQQECFLITDLYGDNTMGFIKVVKMVNRVIDIMEAHGILKEPTNLYPEMPNSKVGSKLTKKDHILKELVETERDYVHHLQNLLALKRELEETGALNGDTSHQIFFNIGELLDYAQRFLINMEQCYAMPPEKQNWGELFMRNAVGLEKYEQFIANQLQCDETCLKEWDNIHNAPRSVDLQQMVALPANLNGFLVKPFQRLTKYPLMLSVSVLFFFFFSL